MEKVEELGKIQGKKLQIYKEIDDVNFDIPFFQIEGSHVKIGGYKHHDNAPRMLFWAKYLQTNIFPFLEKGVNIDGFYNIELHDSYTHLHDVIKERSQEKNEQKKLMSYKNCLVWSKDVEDEHVVLLPDIYHLVNYNNKFNILSQRDFIPWENKNEKIGFWGTTTGDQDPLKNRRINTCLWFLEKDPLHEMSDCYITNIAQMKKEVVLQKVPFFSQIYHKPVNFNHQYLYKFLLDIPGNTCSWDRLPLIMHSNSLFFKTFCKDMCFYYPLLKEGEHYIDVSLENEDILKKRTYFLNNPKEAKFIIKNANTFANNYLHSLSAQKYLLSLFTEAAQQN